MNVLLTRDAAGIARWKPHLSAQGITVHELPCISITHRQLTPELSQIFNSLGSFDQIVFTSSNGVRAFTALCADANVQVPTSLHIAKSAALAAELPLEVNAKILVIRGSLSNAASEALQLRGAHVTEAILYDTQIIHKHSPKCEILIGSDKIDVIVFASPSAVTGFCERITGETLSKAKRAQIVSIGPTTSHALSEAGFTNVREAETSNLDGIIQKLL